MDEEKMESAGALLFAFTAEPNSEGVEEFGVAAEGAAFPPKLNEEANAFVPVEEETAAWLGEQMERFPKEKLGLVWLEVVTEVIADEKVLDCVETKMAEAAWRKEKEVALFSDDVAAGTGWLVAGKDAAVIVAVTVVDDDPNKDAGEVGTEELFPPKLKDPDPKRELEVLVSFAPSMVDVSALLKEKVTGLLL